MALIAPLATKFLIKGITSIFAGKKASKSARFARQAEEFKRQMARIANVNGFALE